jgi:hypothetical protein
MAALACTSKPPADNSASETTAASDANAKETKEAKEKRGGEKEAGEARKPRIVPAGTSVTISLGSALGSKLSQSGQTFSGSVAKEVVVGNEVVILKGAAVSGTVTNAKPLGKFAGGAELQLRLDSINVHGSDLPVQADLRTFSEKGKGKRTAVIAGGGAALGALVGGLAGGGKGAAIGAAAGGGAGTGGAALTGNKDIVLAAEEDVSFELTQPLEIK